MTMIPSATYTSIADLPAGLLPTAFAAGVALIGLHAWLSRRNPVWLGLIVPAVYLLVMAAMAQYAAPTGGLIAGYGTCTVALLVIWWAGADEREKRRYRAAETGE